MIFILLPIYNEAENLRGLIQRIKAGMDRSNFAYRIITYNDGSTDNSNEVLLELANDYPLVVIGKSRNEGLGHAFLSLFEEVCRLSESDEDLAVVLDADNTHNPELVGSMVGRIHNGFDVVIASRYLADSRVVGVSGFRQFLSLGASWLMRVLFPIRGVRDYTCGYRAYSLGCIRRAFAKFPGDSLIEEKGFACMAEMLIKLRTMDVLAVEVPLVLRYDQKIGQSKMNVSLTVKRTLAMLVRLMRVR